MAFSSLLARSSRFVSNLFVSRPTAPQYIGLPCFSTKQDFYGSLVSKVDKVLIKKLPHTLCRKINGEKLESVSLRIPGNVKRIETDESLTVLLDLEAKNFKSLTHRARLNFEKNAVFVRAHVEPKHSPNDPSHRIYDLITSRINLGNDIMYKTIHTKTEDGVLKLTFHKNPENVPPIKFN